MKRYQDILLLTVNGQKIFFYSIGEQLNDELPTGDKHIGLFEGRH